MSWRRVLSSRFVLVPIVLALTIGGWNVYVERHAHGLLEGMVVDANGKPVAGAVVTLFAHDFVTQVEKSRTRSDVAGRFHFDDNNSHLIQLQAQDGAVTSPRVTIRLWFRAQDHVMGKPLRLAPHA
jgi:Carboxypeptidase regulatory-like domain